MTKNEIITKLNEMRPGTFHHFTYRSLKPTVDGSTIYKVSIAYARTKINNTARCDYVKPMTQKHEDVTYLIDNCLKHNNKTNNDLLMLFLRKHNRVKSYYVDANGNKIDNAIAKALIVEKQYNNAFTGVITPNIANLLAID